MMLATDNELHPKEKAWFLAIAKNYGATFRERSQLEEYLRGRPTESLEEALSDVVGEFDRRRLLNFVKMAMRQDGIVRNSEITFFYKIQEALGANPQNDYLQLGRSLLKRDREMRVWNELDRLGNVWSRKLPIFGISGYFYYTDGVFWEALGDLLINNKFTMFFVGAIIAAYIFLV
ncbi:hypothetical protein [Bdellovibrio svalbardensis]|nr:hypothetical protein [Bdellovibrio svalbardensis]